MLTNNLNTNDLLVGNMKFEAVNNFKYSGVNIYNKNNTRWEVTKHHEWKSVYIYKYYC